MKSSKSFQFRLIGLAVLVCFFNPVLKASIENRDSLQRKLYLAIQPKDKIILLNHLAESYLSDDPVKSHNYAQQARTLIGNEGSKTEKAKALYFIAIHNYKQENYFVAYNLMVEAQEIFRRAKELIWYAKSCLELGKIYERQFDFEKAFEVLIKAADLFTKQADSAKLAETFNIIGINYFDQKKYDRAYEYFQKALKIRLKLKDEVTLSSIYNNVGEIYRHKNEFVKALEYFNKAIKINKYYNRLPSLAMNYDNIGNIYRHQGKYDSSLIYLNQSLSISKSQNDKEMISITSISLGHLYKKISQPDIALQYFDTAYQISRQNRYLLLMKDAAFELSEIYSDNNQFHQAYQFHMVYKEVGDSLFNIRNQEEIAQLEMKLLFEQENKIRELQQERTRLVYFVVVFGLVFILVFILLIFGRLRIRIKHSKIKQENLMLESQQLRKEIDFKNRELTTNVMYLVKKNELINFISEKLLKAKSVFKKERQPLVQEIILELQSNIDTDIWKTFEERFIAVHKEFFEKLNSNYPLLTKNDKKLCALLRLNMSTKDIATITHQNLNSIEVARTRLRKKLNISNKDVSLISFLASI